MSNKPPLKDLPRADAMEPQGFRRLISRWGMKPVLVLTGITVVDNLDRNAFVTLAPDLRRTFDLSQAAMNGIAGVSSVLVVLAALPFAVLADRSSRVRLAWLAATFWSALTLLTAAAGNALHLTLARTASGIGQAAIDPVHSSLLTDYYPAQARGRIFSIHGAGAPIAGVIGPALAGIVAAAAGWRWAFIVLVPIGLAVAFLAFRLKEPVRGQVDLVARTPATATPAVPFRQGVRILLRIPTLRALYLSIGTLGFGLVGAPILMSQYFESDLGLGAAERGLILAISGLGSFVGLLVGGVLGDRLFRRNASWALGLTAIGLVVFTFVGAALLFVTWVPLLVALMTLSSFGSGVVGAPVRQVVAAVAPIRVRALSFAMLGIFILLFGGFFGGIILGAIADASSTRTALLLLVIPGVFAGLVLWRGVRHVKPDMAAVLAAEAVPTVAAALLTLRGVTVIDGDEQLLSAVDVDVPAGAIVAVFGDNASVLLDVIGWRVRPDAGVITIDGVDVASETAAELGIAHLAGAEQETLVRLGELAGRPRLLCVDRITAGLPAAEVRQMLDVMAQIRAGGAAVVIRDRLDVALAVADTAVVLQDGLIRYAGPAAAVLDSAELRALIEDQG